MVRIIPAIAAIFLAIPYIHTANAAPIPPPPQSSNLPKPAGLKRSFGQEAYKLLHLRQQPSDTDTDTVSPVDDGNTVAVAVTFHKDQDPRVIGGVAKDDALLKSDTTVVASEVKPIDQTLAVQNAASADQISAPSIESLAEADANLTQQQQQQQQQTEHHSDTKRAPTSSTNNNVSNSRIRRRQSTDEQSSSPLLTNEIDGSAKVGPFGGQPLVVFP